MLNHVEIKDLRPFQAATISGDPLCAARGAIRGALRALGPVAWKSWFQTWEILDMFNGTYRGLYMGLYAIIWD